MRYPNLRYGNPWELQHYAQFIPLKELAKRLRRSERTVHDWLTLRKKVPFWVPELLRLQHKEHVERMRQMNMEPLRLKLGLATAEVIAYPTPGKPSLENSDTFLHGKGPSKDAEAERQHTGTDGEL